MNLPYPTYHQTELYKEFCSLLESKYKENRDFKLIFEKNEVPFTLKSKKFNDDKEELIETYIESIEWYVFFPLPNFCLDKFNNIKEKGAIGVEYSQEQLQYFIDKLK